MAKVNADVSMMIARMAGKSTVLSRAAEKVRAQASAYAAAHKDTGDYSGNFKVARVKNEYGVIDRYVYNDHPAAANIEYGHFIYKKGGALGGWVDGQFNLLRAIGYK